MNDEIFDTKYGKFSVSATADVRSLDRFKRGVFHQAYDVEFLRNFITAESVVVDVGAHIGAMTVPFAIRAKEVHSFEPFPLTRTYLEKNIALNNLTNVVVHPYGAGKENKELFVHVESSVDGGQNTLLPEAKNPNEIRVSVRTLDSEVSYADFLKIDAEGMERDVLEGATKLIAQNHPTIFCEINYGQLWAHNTSPGEIAGLLRKQGYTLYLSLGGTTIGKLPPIALVAGLYHPAFFLGKPRNYAFDILAVMYDRIPAHMHPVSAMRVLRYLMRTALLPRLRRLGK